MGRYDDISPEQLRAELVLFARLILKMEEEDQILSSAVELQRLLGELRQKIFAYEIRSIRPRLPPQAGKPRPSESGAEPTADPVMMNSLKVVREAIQRTERMQGEWAERHPEPPREKE